MVAYFFEMAVEWQVSRQKRDIAAAGVCMASHESFTKVHTIKTMIEGLKIKNEKIKYTQ